MRVLLLVSSLLAIGCGATVVVGDDDDTRGEGGAGGGDAGFECIGACGGFCVKCTGDQGTECIDGQCSHDGLCLPAGSDLECSE